MLRFQRHFALEGLHNRVGCLHFARCGHSNEARDYRSSVCIDPFRLESVPILSSVSAAFPHSLRPQGYKQPKYRFSTVSDSRDIAGHPLILIERRTPASRAPESSSFRHITSQTRRETSGTPIHMWVFSLVRPFPSTDFFSQVMGAVVPRSARIQLTSSPKCRRCPRPVQRPLSIHRPRRFRLGD
jgi:hypothetical protein